MAVEFVMKKWYDRNPEFPNRRTLTPVPGQEHVFDVSRDSEGSASPEGDEFNAQNMNSLEERIRDAFNLIVDYTLPSANATELGGVRLSYGTSLPQTGVEGQIFLLEA